MIHHAVAAALFASTVAVSAQAADVIEPLLWKQRAVVVVGAGPDDARFARQVETLRAKRHLFDDYDTKLIAATPDDLRLRAKLGLPRHGFAVVLVGKDGGVKETWREPVEPARIFGLIDRMPMRRDEVRARR